MIRNHQNPHSASQPKPFQDIINQNIQNIFEDVQKEQFKQISSVLTKADSLKENQSAKDEAMENNDKTIRKEHNRHDLNLLSSKTIRDQNQNILSEIEDLPEFNISYGNGGQIHKTLNCNATFQEIKNTFLEQTKKEKLVLCQNTDNFVTVKKGSLNSCKCIIRMWANSQTDATVYQLRSVNRQSKKLKLILIEGEQSKFKAFCFKITKILHSKGLIKLSNREKIQLFFNENNSQIQKISKQVQKYLTKGNKAKNITAVSEQLLKRTKKQSDRLSLSIKNIQHIDFSLPYERLLEQICFKQSKIFELFDLNFKKDYEIYQKRRDVILKKLNLPEIFKHLQISEHYDQYRRRREYLKGSNRSFEGLPYMPAVKCLQQMKGISSPSSLLERAIIFQDKVKACYNDYFINKLRLSDMDDYLPITIFTVLAMQSDENFLAKSKMLLSYLNEEEEYEWQKKILTNLQVAFQFICREWKVQY